MSNHRLVHHYRNPYSAVTSFNVSPYRYVWDFLLQRNQFARFKADSQRKDILDQMEKAYDHTNNLLSASFNSALKDVGIDISDFPKSYKS